MAKRQVPDPDPAPVGKVLQLNTLFCHKDQAPFLSTP